MDIIYIIYMRTIFLELNMQYYMSQRNKMRLLFFCRGTFKMERETGKVFECRIPPFPLDSIHTDASMPFI